MTSVSDICHDPRARDGEKPVLPRQLYQELAGGQNAFPQPIEGKMLAPGMRAVIRETETDQDRVQPESLPDRRDDGNRPAFADKVRLSTEPFLDRPRSGLHLRTARRDEVWLGSEFVQNQLPSD